MPRRRRRANRASSAAGESPRELETGDTAGIKREENMPRVATPIQPRVYRKLSSPRLESLTTKTSRTSPMIAALAACVVSTLTIGSLIA